METDTARSVIRDVVGDKANDVVDALEQHGYFISFRDVHDENAWLYHCMDQPEWDHPELDGTDWAHPAWWRGQEYSVNVLCHLLTKIVDGEEPQGVCSEPFETLRRRVWELVRK